MNAPLIIAGLAALTVMLVLYAILIPKGGNGKKFDTNRSEDDEVSGLVKFMGNMGNELYEALPEGMIKESKRRNVNTRIESLLIRSGNPWKLKADEFKFIRYIAGFLGIFAGVGAWALLNLFITAPWFLVVPAVAVFCYYIPKIKYNEQAKLRDIEFKRELPEALDLLIITLRGGTSFETGLRSIIPNMTDGILKNEFKNIVKSLDSGKSVNEALEDFANRAPNDGILTFVKSVQSSLEVNAPLVEVLTARAEASRQEFFALINQKTAMLESKIFMILTPFLMPAIMLVSIAPSAASLVGSIGS